ncbi:DUF5025 domain-containing protein [Flavihumibacter rivuli]|uniref:DUF5025 domain-containing protein n=1 Tax=Flavihumibacter rivuli TaxID=2838156 RepID=UPI001BDE9AA2|nr:DUF5025 domain-containing protein [Flavihumibacter rivuli]ULQ57125.1 DUF5025 domain-containing protein [Flavihumibacter rivuli]
MIQEYRFTILFLMLPFLSCRKEKAPDLTLPPATETGQNTLGFLLDGKVWTNYGKRCTIAGCKDNKVTAYLYKQPNGDFDFGVSADYTVTSDTTDQSFYISTTNITTTGTYQIDNNLGRGMAFIGSRYNQWYREYKNNLPNKCTLTITRFDTINNVVAGTFAGILYNPNNLNDSIRIQDGRFDAQLDYRR